MIDHFLVKYVYASREATLVQKHFVIAADAHAGVGKKTFNSAIGLNDNTLIIGAPQVDRPENRE